MATTTVVTLNAHLALLLDVGSDAITKEDRKPAFGGGTPIAPMTATERDAYIAVVVNRNQATASAK